MSIAMPPSNTLSLPARAPCTQRPLRAARAVPRCHGQQHEILRGQKAVEINHNGSTYRLQATRLGKLILTK